MPGKYLIEFLAQWVRDAKLRSDVLYRERTELESWGLTRRQADTLISLDPQAIFNEIDKELKDDFRVDLDGVRTDIRNTGGPTGDGRAAAGSAYEEGQPHVRGIEPSQIKMGVESIVVVRGHGWDGSLEIVFTPAKGGAEVKPNKILDLDSDVDVWQRATLSVTLPTAGTWRVQARVPTSAKRKESVESVSLTVI